jgi:twitching motility protein PilU
MSPRHPAQPLALGSTPDVDIVPFLKLMVKKSASDLFFSAGTSPHIKIEGVTMPVKAPALQAHETKALAYSVMTQKQIAQFESSLEMNLSVTFRELGRFRINVYQQRGDVAMVVRYLKAKIPSFEQLSLPPILGGLIMLKRGLILIVGAAGSGKSTTMASMINYRNESCTGHILCVEDPLEFVHSHQQSVVDQREVGVDTLSYAEALKNAMRESPDVIAIGEIRDRETMQHAIAYADTGHLCVSTLHANNANQAIERIINFFPEDARRGLLMDLSLNLRAVVSQRLIPGTSAAAVPAVEVMLVSPLISDLIQNGRVDEIKDVMARSTELGMATFDQSLYTLWEQGKITLEEALHNADSLTDLKLRIKLTHPVALYGEQVLDATIDKVVPTASAELGNLPPRT